MKLKNLKLFIGFVLSIILVMSAITITGCTYTDTNDGTEDTFSAETAKKDTSQTDKDTKASLSFKNAPQDFSLNLYWSTGVLSPQYCYSYNISCGPGLEGVFEYQPGYGLESASDAWVTEFNISAESMDDLYVLLEENDFFRDVWEKSVPSEGGSYIIIKINANNNSYEIPPDFELKSEDFQKINKVYDFVKNLVPETIWTEMERMQAEFEKSYQEYED